MSHAVKADVEKEVKPNQAHPPHHCKHHVGPGTHALPTAETAPSLDGLPPLPKGCKPLTHQVAGHRFGQGRLRLGMLEHADGSIMKPVQPPPRGECEVNFYSKVFDQNCTDPVLQTLRPFLPKFLGTCYPITPGSEDESPPQYLKLEDACKRFRNPSIVDIKIGRVSYDPDADPDKIAFESGKYPPQKKLGFQLLGTRVSGPSPNEATFYDKKWGRSLTEETITDGLEIFFSGNKAWRKHLIKAFIQRLETILIWFESQTQFQFYSSSLLLIYEGEFFDGSSDSDEEFIHKYRSYLPHNFHVNECFRAIDQVLQANLAAVSKQEILQEASEATQTNRSQQALTTSTRKDVQEKSTEQKRENEPSQPENNTNQNPVTTENVSGQSLRGLNGGESGYSSEVDSKKKATDAGSQREFVNNLRTRMRQHAMVEYSKYRFPPDLVDVKMIDFTHVFEDRGKDDNYIYGLRNLIAHLRHLLKHS